MTSTAPAFFYQWYASHYRLEDKKSDPRAHHSFHIVLSKTAEPLGIREGLQHRKTKASHLLGTENNPLREGGEQMETKNNPRLTVFRRPLT